MEQLTVEQFKAYLAEHKAEVEAKLVSLEEWAEEESESNE